jgi:hypothetical protein
MIEPFTIDDFAFRQNIELPNRTIRAEGNRSAARAIGSIRVARQNRSGSEILIRFMSPLKEDRVFSLALEAEKVDGLIAALEELALAIRNARDVPGSI